MNFRFSRSCRKHSKHSHGSWILRAAGPAQPRGGGHPWRGDQYQPSAFNGTRNISIPSIWIPGGQIPMGSLFWQSIKGRDPKFYIIPPSLAIYSCIAIIHNCILYLFSYKMWKSRLPLIILLPRITWTATGGSCGARSRDCGRPARGAADSSTRAPSSTWPRTSDTCDTSQRSSMSSSSTENCA